MPGIRRRPASETLTEPGPLLVAGRATGISAKPDVGDRGKDRPHGVVSRHSFPAIDWPRCALKQISAITKNRFGLCCTRRSCLQLAFELVEEAPICAVGNDPIGSRLDQPSLVQPKRVKANRVLGVVIPPSIVRYLV